jgi:hypothetical protein
MGAAEIPRATFLALLQHHCPRPGRDGPWRLDADLMTELLPPSPP